MKSEPVYGFGIIGLGSIAETHVEAIEMARGCRFVGGYHRDKAKADAFCRPHDGTGYDDLAAFLGDPDLDVVVVATPSGLHLEASLAAIGVGKHVIVEKPLEVTTRRCDTILSAAKAAGVSVGGIFQSRFLPASQILKQAVDAGRFGTISLVDAQFKWYRSQEYYDSGVWRGTWQYDGGGVLMNQGIHAVDLLGWFGGPVKEVAGYCATRGHERIEVEDTVAATLRFANGALGILEGSTSAYPGNPKRIEICGSDGNAILEENRLMSWKFREERKEDADILQRFGPGTSDAGKAMQPSGLDPASHALQFEDFAMALREKRKPAIDGVEARKAVQLVEAVYASAREGSPVSL